MSDGDRNMSGATSTLPLTAEVGAGFASLFFWAPMLAKGLVLGRS